MTTQLLKIILAIGIATFALPVLGQRVLSGDTRHFSLNNQGRLWQIWVNYGVYQMNPKTKSFIEHPAEERFRQIHVAPNGTIYVVSYENLLYTLVASSPKQTLFSTHKVLQVAVSPTGKVWTIGLDNEIYSYTPDRKPQKYVADAYATEIAVDSKDNVYHLGKDGRIWVSDPLKKTWGEYNPACPRANNFAITPKDEIWVIDKNNDIDYPHGKGWRKYPARFKARQLAISHDDFLYYIDASSGFLVRTKIDIN